MASRGSFIRSAARATSSAYRRLPIRWRLAGGSAVLTLVILLGFATIVGVLTTRRIQQDFNREVADTATDVARKIGPRVQVQDLENGFAVRLEKGSPSLDTYVTSRNEVIRVLLPSGQVLSQTANAPYLVPPRATTEEFNGYRIESRRLSFGPYGDVYVQYARRLSVVKATANRVRVFLGIGVLGGAALALLAGLATARRAMEPIAELTAAAREV